MVRIQRVLCPVDFSEPSRGALRQAGAMLEGLGGGELLVLHVVEPILYPIEYGMAPVPTVDLETTVTQNATKELDELVRELVPQGVNVTTRVVVGRADQQVCDQARDWNADMVILATHGRTGLKHFLLGSVAERVVRHCEKPVLTVKG